MRISRPSPGLWRRELTSRVSWLLDNLLPPLLRDSRWVMAPLFRLAYGPQLAKQVMGFKEHAHGLSDQAYTELYAAYSRCPLGSRCTDLNAATVKRLLQLLQGHTVLDAGCGRGFLLSVLANQRPDLAFTGCDVVLPAEQERAAGVQWVAASLEALPFADQAFDTVLCTHTLEHVQDLPKALAELRRVRQQRLIVVLPNPPELRQCLW